MIRTILLSSTSSMMRMRKLLMLISFLCTFQLAFSETYYLNVNEPKFLGIPFTNWVVTGSASWNCDHKEIDASTDDKEVGVIITIKKKFSGAATISVSWTEEYYNSRTGHSQFTAHYHTWTIYCIGGDDNGGGGGGGTVTTGELHIIPETLELEEGEEYTMSCWATGLTGSVADTWSSSNSSVATVERTAFYTAKVKAKSAGQCAISVTSGGLTATCNLTVKKKAVTGIAIDATNFPDANFRNYLLSQSYGEDGVITAEEIKNIRVIDVDRKNISSLKGIEYFSALTELNCSDNQLTDLDVSKNTALKTLRCSDNQLTALDVSKNTALKTLRCTNNQLTALDVSKNTALTDLTCYNNPLTALDVSKNTALTILLCFNNQLTALDVSKNTALTILWCDFNQLTALDVSKNTALTELYCGNNMIKGKAMDALISSLPQNTTTEVHLFRVINPTSKNEGNVCTKTQVAAVKAKGWFPCYYDSNTKEYVEYEGSEEVKPIKIVLPSTATVVADEKITLTPEITPENAEYTLTWSSDDETVATVDANGVVTGKKKGQTYINVETDNGLTGWCKLTVTNPAPTAIALSKKETVYVGETITLTPEITPANAETTLTWTSEEPAIATVSDGVVTGVSEGLTVIYVTTDNGIRSNACKVTVTYPVPTAIALPAKETVYVGATITLTPEITPANAKTTLTWTSDDPTIATVADGVVTGKSEGLTVIYVTTDNGLRSKPCKLTVTPDPSGINDLQADNNSAPVYTLSGQRLAAPRKGVNIVGGRKVVVK